MMVEPRHLAAIAAMALATYATRIGGLYLLRFLSVKGRVKAALDALPPAILVAVITPTILTTGPAETIAAGITLAVALARAPLLVSIAAGVVSVIALRHFL